MKKNVVLSDPQEIRTFLKVLAQESVKKARRDIQKPLREADELDDLLKGVDDDNAGKTAPAKDSKPKQAAPSAPAPDQKQAKTAAPVKPDTQPGPPSSETEKDYGQDTMKKKLFTIEDLKEKDVSLDSLLDKLNTIRAGKSFKDEQVSAQLEEYYNSLSSTERMALYAFLKGLAQLSLGEIEGASAVKPDSDPPGIQMARQEPDVAVKPSKSDKTPETGALETKPDAKPAAEPDATKTEIPQEEEEDDAAPIKVGSGKTKVEALRRKVRQMLNEGN